MTVTTQPPATLAATRPPVSPASQALRVLYDRYHPALHSYLAKLTLGDVGLAEDLAQETFLRAWRHLTEQPGTDLEAFRPWLYTVARRLVVDHLRARRARPPESFVDDLTRTPTADDPIAAALAVGALREAIRALSSDQRQLLALLYVQGRTPTQVADLLGVPVGTVKSRAYYAKRALRARLEG